jgi:hypothetical protein
MADLPASLCAFAPEASVHEMRLIIAGIKMVIAMKRAAHADLQRALANRATIAAA